MHCNFYYHNRSTAQPGSVLEWDKIWEANIKRAYKADFEVYDERSRDWDSAEVDIFINI